MGLREECVSPLGVVPGAGGVDVDGLARDWAGPPSRRNVILWPKAYECPQGKALPVFEALKLCWASLPPCELHMLVMTPETRMWYETLPAEIRASCRVEDRIPRQGVLELMTRARVLLAPSLSDGVPNSLYEAMAAGAFPVVSPLETITPVVGDEQNALFARNLYPEEIAAALTRAMTDDALVDAAAERNLALVRRVANRAEIRGRVVDFYERLAARPAAARVGAAGGGGAAAPR
jgi:glycosyltransferase involved in cell wall biosynthesis